MDEFYPNSLTHTLKQYIVCKRKLEGFKEAREKRCLHFEAFFQVSHFIYLIPRKLFINTCIMKSTFHNLQEPYDSWLIGYVLALPMLFIAWWNTSQFMPLTWLEKILGPFVQKAFMKIKSSHLHNKFRWACWINIYDNCLRIVPTFASRTIKWHHCV